VDERVAAPYLAGYARALQRDAVFRPGAGGRMASPVPAPGIVGCFTLLCGSPPHAGDPRREKQSRGLCVRQPMPLTPRQRSYANVYLAGGEGGRSGKTPVFRPGMKAEPPF